MFRSIWSKSLRDYRVPILGWGLGLGLLLLTVLWRLMQHRSQMQARAPAWDR